MRVALTLTREQRRAIASRAPALAIHAGAGSGKTLTLAHRVAALVGRPADKRATPHLQARIAVVTFTRDATASLQRRLSILLGRDHLVRVSSFHQWAARELPREGRRFLDEAEARRIVEDALRRAPRLEAALGGTRSEAAARLAGLFSFAKNRETTIVAALSGPHANLARHERDVVAAHESYEAKKGDRLDYDDLPILFRDLLKRDRKFLAGVRARLDHVLVDEYQDVNAVQDQTLRLVCSGRGAPNVTIVGDPRQAIYAFRAGSPDHLLTFPERIGRRCDVIGLTTNFRASRALVEAANRVEPGAFPMRAAKKAARGVAPELAPCADADEEARRAADRVQRLLDEGVDPAEVVVLCRARHHAFAYADHARRRSLEHVAVRTIHASKGLEWDHVILVGAREGGLPSDHAIHAPEASRAALLAEERRLLYVALTRARRSFLATWGGPRAVPSRFLTPWLPVGGEAVSARAA